MQLFIGSKHTTGKHQQASASVSCDGLCECNLNSDHPSHMDEEDSVLKEGKEYP